MMTIRFVFIIAWVIVLGASSVAQPFAARTQMSTFKVRSNDGTSLTVECTGGGPTLLIVHGGTGDRRRWKPLFPLFATHFTVCAMDRRGHGESEVGSNYNLQKEFEDVVAVVNALPEPVFVLGHSYGGVCALEAALLTKKIAKLILYEPPLQDLDHTAIADRMDRMIRANHREEALITFLQKIVMLSPPEIAAMKAQPSWPARVAGVDIQIREIRALSRYRFDPKRLRTLKVPTLLLTGGKTASPQLRQAIRSLTDSLPNRSLYVFEGQGHNAMDNLPEQFVEAVTDFLLNKDKTSGQSGPSTTYKFGELLADPRICASGYGWRHWSAGVSPASSGSVRCAGPMRADSVVCINAGWRSQSDIILRKTIMALRLR